jgi:hypothetical protein
VAPLLRPGMRNGHPPERPDFLDDPGGRVRTREAQIDRLKVKLERTYRTWLTCRSPELKEMLESKVIEYEERIDQLDRLNRAARGE